MTTTPDLTSYDVILLNTSAGKDSQASLDLVHELATDAGFDGWFVAAHADLGRVEWEGTRELAEKQAAQYAGVRFEVVQRDGDLLDQVVERRASLDAKGKTDAPAWPSSQARYCTSDQKTGQVTKLMTRLVDELGAAGRLGEPVRYTKKGDPVYRQARILNCLGIRADESPERARKRPFHKDCASNGKRHVDRWLPIFTWTEPQVWDRIRQSGVPWHPAYDLGMSRLSCVFCVFASKADLTIAAKHNPELAREYVEVEIQVRSTFRADLSMADVVEAAEAELDAEEPVQDDLTVTAETESIYTDTQEDTVNVTITGPNPHGGMFHVHRTGCADLSKGVYKRLAADKARTGYAELYEQEHASIESIVEDMYSDIIAEHPEAAWEDYVSEFKFFPCVDELPYEEPIGCRPTGETLSDGRDVLSCGYPANPAGFCCEHGVFVRPQPQGQAGIAEPPASGPVR